MTYFDRRLTASPTLLWDTPNGLWAIIALVVYFAFPYDLSPDGLSAQGPLTPAFFAKRLPLWAILTFGYVAFWHISLYSGIGWSKRPFIKVTVSVIHRYLSGCRDLAIFRDALACRIDHTTTTRSHIIYFGRFVR